MAKTGPKSKDSSISDQFNEDKLHTTKKDIAKAQRQSVLVARKLKREADAKKKLERDIKAAQKKGIIVPGMEGKEPKDVPDDPKDKDNQKSAQQMLSDLRFAYRNAVGPGGKKGKARLVELMKSDNEFKFMVKELTKVEAALLSAQIRKEGPEPAGNQTTFVILKGLEDERSILGLPEQTDFDKQKSILLNPDGTEREKL